MGKTRGSQSPALRRNPKKALELLHKLEQAELPEKFRGMTKEQIIQEIKKTREEIWREKIANRS